MPKIREVFDIAKPIDRRIEKVITYETTDENLLRQEIQEYVATERIEQNFERLLDLLDEGMSSESIREIGVWVSGFYGSGKSSFTKYLGFALDPDRKMEEKPFLQWLQNQFTSKQLRARIATVAQKHPATIIMLDLAAQQFTGASQEKVSNTLYYSVMQWAGYSRDKKIAYLEFMLERDGKVKDFERRVGELVKGKTWREIKNQPLVVKTIASKLAAEFYPDIWTDSKEFNEIVLDEAEKEDDRVREMLDLIRRKSGKKNVIFIIDEVGQFVAQRDDFILNLDGLAKNLKNIGIGHAWIIATAQQTLTEDDPRAALNTAKLFKLKDRFPVAVDLEASDIREICYRRLLAKSKDGDSALRDIFDKYGPQLRHSIALKNTRYYSTELDKETFCKLYPFLPQHFEILFELLARLAKTSGGIGLRSAIKIIQDVLVDQSKLRPGAPLLADAPVGSLATTVVFYDTLKRDIERSFRHIVEGVDKVEKVFGESSIHTQVAKSIAVLQMLDDFPLTSENIAALLHPTVDSSSLLDDVKNAVEALLVEPTIPLNDVDGNLRFMSAAVLDLENERLKIVVRTTDTRNIFNTALRTIFTPSPSAKLNGTRTVNAGMKININGTVIPLAGEKEEIQIQMAFIADTEYEKKKEEYIIDSQQKASNKVVFLLAREQKEVDDLLVEAVRCRTIYDNHRNKPADKEVEDYLRAQSQRADGPNGLIKEVERLLKKTLAGGSFIFRGKPRSVNEFSDEVNGATKIYLDTIAKEVFDKYAEAPVQAESVIAERFLKTEKLDKIASHDDPLSLVKKTGSGSPIDTGNRAIVSISDYLEYHGQVDGRKMLDDFYAAPYGWSKDTTRYIVAAMLAGGIVKLRVSGEDIVVPGEVALNAIKNTISFNKIGISLRDGRPSPDNLLRARDRLVHLTGEDILPLEPDISKAVMKHFPDFQRDYASLGTLLENLQLPGVEKAENIQDGLSEILKGDASDATNRLGGEECQLFDDLLWARDVKKAFDNGIDSVVKEANELLNEIPKLPDADIPGDLISETQEAREKLKEYCGREDFYAHMPEMKQWIGAITTKIQEMASLLAEKQKERLNAEKTKIQDSSLWNELGQDEQAYFATKMDALEVDTGIGLNGFKQLINNQFVIASKLHEMLREIELIVEGRRKERRIYEKNLSHLPQTISSENQIDDIVTELDSLKEQLKDYDEIVLKWK